MKSLILAEKPSVARDIADALQINQKRNGYFENNQYIVTWALGSSSDKCDTLNNTIKI